MNALINSWDKMAKINIKKGWLEVRLDPEDSRIRLYKSKEFTEEDEESLQEVLNLLKEGGIDKSSIKRILKSVEKEINPLKILVKIKSGIPKELFQGTFVSGADISGPKEVILSEYLLGK